MSVTEQADLREALRQVSAPEDFHDLLSGHYLESIGIDQQPQFNGGNPVKIIPPKQTTRNSVLILGAYPTAIFDHIDRHMVPVDNIDEPFDPNTASGRELDEQYLMPLSLERKQSWITNLVKVFLFKETHIGSRAHANQLLARSNFEQLASSDVNLDWLEAELRIAAPKVIITLGREVAGIVRGINGDRRRNELLSGSLQDVTFGGVKSQWAHLPHPGIVMRKESEWNKWPKRHQSFCLELRDPIRAALASQV
jgi:hypothetical protein